MHNVHNTMNYAVTISAGWEKYTAMQGCHFSLPVFLSCPVVLTCRFLTMVTAACAKLLLLHPAAAGWVVVSAVWPIWFFHAANDLDQ